MEKPFPLPKNLPKVTVPSYTLSAKYWLPFELQVHHLSAPSIDNWTQFLHCTVHPCEKPFSVSYFYLKTRQEEMRPKALDLVIFYIAIKHVVKVGLC